MAVSNPAAEELLARLARHPDDEAALGALCELYRTTQEWEALVLLLERRPSAIALAEAAEIVETQLRQSERALALYRRAIERDGRLSYAIYRAREICRLSGRFDEAVALYTQEIEVEPDPARKVGLLYELSHIRGSVLRDIDGAIRDLYAALEVAPDDVAVLGEIAAQLVARSELGRTGAHRDRQVAADLWLRIAATSLPSDAFELAARALDLVPDQEKALAMLERLAPELGREGELPARWVQFLTHAPDAPSAVPRRAKLGDAYIAAGQLKDAIACLLPLAEAGDAFAAEKLCTLYPKVGRPEDAARFSDLALLALPAEERVRRIRALVRDAEAQGNVEAVRAHMRAILEVDPSDVSAIAFVEADCARRGAWGEWRELLLASVRSPSAPIPLRVKRLREVAKISESNLVDLPGAIGAWRAITALDPVDVSARRELRRLLREAGRLDELSQVLDKDIANAPDVKSKVEALHAVAALHRDHRGDLPAAISAWTELMRLAPTDTTASDALCDALIAEGRHAEARPLLQRRLEASIDSATRSKTLVRIAEIAMNAGETSFAVESFSTCVALGARADAEARKRATTALADLHARGGEQVKVVDLWRGALALESKPEERVAIRKKIARGLAAMGDRDGADREWQTVLATAPDDTEALRVMLEFSDARGDTRASAGYLARLVQTASDPSEKIALSLRRAQLLQGALRGPDQAQKELSALLETTEAPRDKLALLDALAALPIEPVRASAYAREAAAIAADTLEDENGAWRRLVARITAKADPETERALTDLAMRTDRCDQLGDFLLWRAARERDPAEKTRLLTNAAAAFSGEGGDPGKAFDAWRQAYLISPERNDWFETLEALAPNAGRIDALLPLYDERRKNAGSDDEALQLLLRAALLADSSLRDRERAFVLIGQAIVLSLRVPDGQTRIHGTVRAMDESVDRRRELAGDDARRALVGAYLHLAERSAGEDPRGAAELFLRAADLTERELSDRQGAYPWVVQAEQLAPELPSVVAAMRRFSERTGVRTGFEARTSDPEPEILELEDAVAVDLDEEISTEPELEEMPDAFEELPAAEIERAPAPSERSEVSVVTPLHDAEWIEEVTPTPPARPRVPKPPPKKR